LKDQLSDVTIIGNVPETSKLIGDMVKK